MPLSNPTWAKWLEDARKFEDWNDSQDRKVKAKKRGAAFVNLFVAAKQLVDAYPKRFPYLEQRVRGIEEDKLAPQIMDPKK